MTHENFSHPPAMLYPVILQVNPEVRQLSGSDRARALSRIARLALALSAEISDLKTGDLVKNAQGAPMPNDGIYWSVTHKPEYVAGMLGPSPIGIDLEKIRPVHQGIYRKVADDAQWVLDDSVPLIRFFRFWTAKEAVLKACGTGLRDLSECRIEKVSGPDRLIVCYQKKYWSVFHIFFDGHVAAAAGRNIEICWNFEDHYSEIGSGATGP